MSVLTIMLARHAEKPGRNFPGPGVTTEGVEDEKSLVVRGWQRAGAWAGLFGSGFANADYPRPSVIYAAAPESVAKDADFSHRPYETAIPVAERLHLKAVTKWGVSQEPELVKEITKLTGVVLVFWEHKAIVSEIIPALQGDQPLPGVPKKWDGDRFDVVLRFDRALPNAPWSFRQLSPRLLSGDTDKPFAKREE
ncbi:histidine phosphatase family protein [Methylobacterium planeticum]|uniref:Histidine phosphatase family protein n=2 Tax=Methylobacterium planeticum TaxID=2615211 RepID=A0A6N6MGH8_9HYPH|nr:histidine phosphatase family protein [Methylobacterium planeticum]